MHPVYTADWRRWKSKQSLAGLNPSVGEVIHEVDTLIYTWQARYLLLYSWNKLSYWQAYLSLIFISERNIVLASMCVKPWNHSHKAVQHFDIIYSELLFEPQKLGSVYITMHTDKHSLKETRAPITCNTPKSLICFEIRYSSTTQ